MSVWDTWATNVVFLLGFVAGGYYLLTQYRKPKHPKWVALPHGMEATDCQGCN
jgi:hypothetical protein